MRSGSGVEKRGRPDGSCLVYSRWWALARAPAAFAGRAFAAYAGVYLLGALLWLIVVDRMRPDRWDLLGAGLALAGALIIVYGLRRVPQGPP